MRMSMINRSIDRGVDQAGFWIVVRFERFVRTTLDVLAGCVDGWRDSPIRGEHGRRRAGQALNDKNKDKQKYKITKVMLLPCAIASYIQ